MAAALDIGGLPDEIILSVFQHLNDFSSVAAFRLAGTRYAEIGAEVLVNRIRFHAMEDSLDRLKHFANHEAIAKNVDTVVFEGNLLAFRSLKKYFDHL